MGRESVGSEETHQDRTSASDRPTDCMGCPVDSAVAKERGLLDGGGVFRWTLWSGHVRGLDEGDASCSGGNRALGRSEFLPSDGQQRCELISQGGRVLGAGTTARERVGWKAWSQWRCSLAVCLEHHIRKARRRFHPHPLAHSTRTLFSLLWPGGRRSSTDVLL